MFNKTEFSRLVLLSRGNRTNVEFSKDSGVNRTYISKIINEKLNNPPAPYLIKRLADSADNDITYESLMSAAGYLQNSTDAINTTKHDTEPKIDNLIDEMKLFFMNGTIAEEDKEQVLRDIQEFYWEAKDMNKKKNKK